jgi:hypothetical protein
MIPQTIYSLVKAASPSREDFESGSPFAHHAHVLRSSGSNAILMVVTFVLTLLLLSMIGYYLWNNVVAGADRGDTGLFTFAKKANSVWQIIGLFLLMSLFSGGCCATNS